MSQFILNVKYFLNAEFLLESQAIVCIDGIIKKICPLSFAKKKFPNFEVIDATDKILMPSFVNAHTHVAMGFFRGFGHGKKTLIEKYLFPAEKKLSAELIKPLCYAYIAAGIKSGVSFFNDHYYFSKDVAKAFESFGVRASVGETIADLGGAFPTSEKHFEGIKKDIENWSFSDKIIPVLAPHAADTVSPKLMQKIAAFAQSKNLSIHLHLSQTKGERQRVAKKHKVSPVMLALKNNLLGPKTLAVHLISADQKDIEILKKTNTFIGFCPSSQIIYEHLAPIESFPLTQTCLGTDAAACNDSGDIMAELNLAGLLLRDRSKKPVDPKKILNMVLANPYRHLGLEKSLGKIAEGYSADFVFLKPDISVEPLVQQFTQNVLYSLKSRHVTDVMVGGSFVLKNSKLTKINEDTARSDYNEAVREIHKLSALAKVVN